MEYFPGSWKRIYTIAILRTVYGCRFKRMEAHYQDSIASLAYPSLALSPSSITPLLRNLGRNREAIRLFMGSIRGAREGTSWSTGTGYCPPRRPSTMRSLVMTPR